MADLGELYARMSAQAATTRKEKESTVDGGKLQEAAEALEAHRIMLRDREGIMGGPTKRARRHRIVVEMTDPKKTEAIRKVEIYARKVKGFQVFSDFLNNANEADMMHVEQLLGI